VEIPDGVQGKKMDFVVSSVLVNGTRMSHLVVIPYILSFWQGIVRGAKSTYRRKRVL